MASGPDQPDFFYLLPDPILLLILNRLSDIKALLRCRSVCRRFDALVPQSDSLLLRVDRVISASRDASSFLSTIFKSLVTSFRHLVFPGQIQTRLLNSPSRILRGFHAIKSLRIELPAGDLRLDKGASIRWVARFGETLQSCVILASGGGGGLKMRVVWTISALIAASARHYMAAEVIAEQRFLSHLIVCDKENEGTMIIDKDGLREFRERTVASADETDNGGDGGVWWGNHRTTVPAVGMRMRYEPKLELSSGMVINGATLVVVRPSAGGQPRCEAEETYSDEALAAAAFGSGIYAEAVEKLLKSRSYILEMNSF